MPLPVKTSIVLLLFLAAGAIAGGYGILGDPSRGFLMILIALLMTRTAREYGRVAALGRPTFR